MKKKIAAWWHKRGIAVVLLGIFAGSIAIWIAVIWMFLNAIN